MCVSYYLNYVCVHATGFNPFAAYIYIYICYMCVQHVHNTTAMTLYYYGIVGAYTRRRWREKRKRERQNERCVHVIDLEDLKYGVFDSVTAKNARDDDGYDTLPISLSPTSPSSNIPFPPGSKRFIAYPSARAI